LALHCLKSWRLFFYYRYIMDTDDKHPECRICLIKDNGSVSGKLLDSPCSCRGTQAYVHEGCLNKWRFTSPRNFFRCSVCGDRYSESMLHPYKVDNWIVVYCVPFMIWVVNYLVFVYVVFESEKRIDDGRVVLLHCLLLFPVLLNLGIMGKKKILSLYCRKAFFWRNSVLYILALFLLYTEPRISMWMSKMCVDLFWYNHVLFWGIVVGI
jgi:E3 ubiquitin-protein ligase DOA10